MIHDAPVIIADSVLGIVPRVILAILRIVAAKICAAILVTGKLVCVGIGLAEDAQIFAVFIGAVQSFHQAVLITVVCLVANRVQDFPGGIIQRLSAETMISWVLSV